MPDLVERLEAAIAAKAAKAREAQQYSPTPWTATDPTMGSGGVVLCDHDPHHVDPAEADTYVAGCEHRHDADFIADNDPKTVLAMCEAHQQIVDLFKAALARTETGEQERVMLIGERSALHIALLMIARGYRLADTEET